jgi:hypothetical protein
MPRGAFGFRLHFPKLKDHGTYPSAVDRSLPSLPLDAFVSLSIFRSTPRIASIFCFAFLALPGEEEVANVGARGCRGARAGSAGGTGGWCWWIVKYWPDWRAPRRTFSSDAFASMATDDNEDDHYHCYPHYYHSCCCYHHYFDSGLVSSFCSACCLPLPVSSPAQTLVSESSSLHRPCSAFPASDPRSMATDGGTCSRNFQPFSPRQASHPCRDAIFFIASPNSAAKIHFVLMLATDSLET